MFTTFIGIDLAWQCEKNHTGIAVFRKAISGVELVDYSRDITSMEGIEAYLDQFIASNTVIAIDAPLVITNQTGQRRCETQISQEFGSRHASTHSSNLTHSPTSGLILAKKLVALGFEHGSNPEIARGRSGCWLFEVYPHAAQIELFNLSQIIKYKKGRIAQKRAGLQTLRRCIESILTAGTPALVYNPILIALFEQNVQKMKGSALKRYEDTLDALICAYLATYYWTWGAERNRCFGDLDTGYIINPTRTP